MSSTLKIVVDAQRTLQELRALPHVARRVVASALWAAAQETVRIEKAEAPAAGGVLQRSIRARRETTLGYAVAPEAPYAQYVHTGTRAGYMPPLEPLIAWARRQRLNASGGRFRSTSHAGAGDVLATAKALQWHIKAHGTKANPFADRAAQKAIPRTHELVRLAVGRLTLGGRT
ncbi:HK97 gp10 family phage protein [Paraburkholderia adhaesiva]|uniref:HK97 gp10 family phage protein n=1 Tax=Paraburkholderia adhaesiva TaxID=2883244 RepID=UPI001F18DAC7|nr:HK97 gp10 family phage protein [Paraburkholderia adhaesiva]